MQSISGGVKGEIRKNESQPELSQKLTHRLENILFFSDTYFINHGLWIAFVFFESTFGSRSGIMLIKHISFEGSAVLSKLQEFIIAGSRRVTAQQTSLSFQNYQRCLDSVFWVTCVRVIFSKLWNQVVTREEGIRLEGLLCIVNF